MNEIRNIVRFYKDCYQTDLKGVRIRNFVSNQCEKRFIPNNNEFFHENYLGIPIDTKWGKAVDENLFLNSKEKALYAGSFFIRGTQNTLGRKKTAYTPLYIHELEIKLTDEVYFISTKETFLNPDFVELANNLDININLNFDTLSNGVPPNPFGFGNFVILQNYLKKHFNTWDITDLENYQSVDFDFAKYYKDLATNKKEEKKIFSYLMFGVFKKPTGSLGVLTELKQMSAELPDSRLLKHLFQIQPFSIQNLIHRDIFLPTTLSEKQESAFYGADAYPITQIIGPPGTGKSYTISALAIDAISNNKSVLIVTRNVQASKVITNIIEKQFGLRGSVIKAYNQVYKRSLISKLSKAIKIDFQRVQSPSQLGKKIRILISQIEKIETQIIDIGNSEYEWGEFYSQNQENFFSIFKDRWYQYRKRSFTTIWKLNEKLKYLREQKTRLVKKYIKIKIQHDLSRIVKRKKIEFIKLNHALKESNLTLLDKKISKVDFDLVLKAIPLWTSTTKEISKCLPLASELFDLVIFDEASQCDLATAIPSIYRAKKLIVVGDPHQLRHISFLSKQKQNELKKNHKIKRNIADYRKESLIDWTNQILSNPEQTTYLDEHFRSKTSIIQFSNRKFYDNQLKLIRSNPIDDRYNSLEVIITKGKRDTKGINAIEISEVLKRVQSIINKYSESIPEAIPSIGISSPFTEQVKQLKKVISQSITFDQLKKFKVLIGTPFHFQGEERDIMLITFCVDRNSHSGSFNYLNRSDVFNVLVTRARNKQIVITSVNPNQLSTNSLLKEYLETNPNEQDLQGQNNTYDNFYDEVSSFLIDSGYEFLQHSTIVAGILIDLVVLHESNYFCIDLIGYPGEFENQFSLEELRILNRVDVPIFFLPYSSWYLESEKSKKNLVNFIEKLQLTHDDDRITPTL